MNNHSVTHSRKETVCTLMIIQRQLNQLQQQQQTNKDVKQTLT